MICKTCNSDKTEESFSWEKKDIKRSKRCKECQRKLGQKHYQENKAQYCTRDKNSRNLRYKFKFEFLSGKQCVACSESDPVMLEFDHLRDKKYNISDMLKKRYSIESILAEIEKCQILCANCHRRKTAKQFKWYRNYLKSIKKIL